MTIEEFDKKINEGADVFIAAAKDWAKYVESALAEADKADLPEHLVNATLNQAAKRIEAIGE